MKDPLSGIWNIDEHLQWRFFCVRKIIYYNGTVLYEGVWYERQNGRSVRTASYQYDPSDRELMIDHTEPDADGFPRYDYTDCYQIVAIDPAERRLQCQLTSSCRPIIV